MAKSLPVLKRVIGQLLPDASVPVSKVVMDNAVMPYLDAERLNRLDSAFEKAGQHYTRIDALAASQWTFPQLSELFRTIQGYEISQKHGQWLDEYGHTLDAPIRERAVWARTITSEQYEQALLQQQEVKTFITTEWVGEQQIVVMPTTPGAPPALNMPAEPLAQYRSELMGLTAIAGLCGLPQLHLPMANLSYGPAGISLLGPANSELSLLDFAESILNGGEQL